MVPFVDEFIEKIDLEDKKIYIKEMKGLFDED
jgi:ribosomal 30S subunit maturation factor RimM